MIRLCGVVPGLIGLIALFAVPPAAAQGLGVKGGVTLSNIVVKPSDVFGEDGYSADVGGLGGVYLTFREGGRFSIEIGAQAALRRVSFGGGDSVSIKDSLTYLEVPAVVRYPVIRIRGARIAAIGGGSFNILLAAKESFLGDSYDTRDSFKAYEAALVVGALAELGRKLTIDVRYLLGSDPFSVDIDFITARQQGWQFSVGYRLR